MRRRSRRADAVITRLAVSLGIALAILWIYVSIVLGPSLVTDQSGMGEPGLVRPIVASVLVAMLFEPLRGRHERLVNRWVLGGRISPHELLSSFTASLPGVATSEGTGDLARLLASGTGADRATVWVTAEEGLRASGVFPANDTAAAELASTAELPDGPSISSQLVQHRGALLGAAKRAAPRWARSPNWCTRHAEPRRCAVHLTPGCGLSVNGSPTMSRQA